jgi:PAS domain S-box-containing protein
VYVLIFLLVVAVVVGFLWYDLRAAYHDTLTYWDSSLSNAADEQANVETLWLLERRTDTEAIANNPATIRLLGGKVSSGNLGQTRQEVELEIDKMARINGFMGGAAADTECRIMAQTGVPAEAREGIQKACREAQAVGHSSIVAGYTRPAHVLLNLAFPVSAAQGALPAAQPSPHVSGTVVMITEPRKTVFRFFAERSRPDQFAETEIMWQDEGEAVSFSPRLNTMGMESVFRQPLGGNNFESQAARKSNLEFGEFIDYRGVRVFGVARPIVPAGASLARKVDRDKALSEFHRRVLLEWLAGSLSLLLFGSVMVAQHRHLALRDLQEKLRQQQALSESERRYRILFESAGDAIFLIRGETFIDCNQRALEMYRCTRDEIIGQALTARYPQSELDGPHPRQAALEKLRQARDGQTLHFEWRAHRLDGTTFDAEITLSRLGIEGDVLLLALVRDVTDRKQAEESLRESEELFRTTFETAGVGMTLVDMQGHPMNANPALQRILGYSEDELRSMPFTEFTHPDDREHDWGLFQELAAGKREKYEIEKRYIRKDGQVVWGQLTASLVKGADGRPVYGVGMVEDITDRKRAAEALQASEARFRTLMERAPVAISISRRGVTLYVNQKYLEMYGLQGVDEVVGHSIGEQWSPECRAMVEERARKRSGGLIVPARYEAMGQRRDGSVFPVEVAIAKVDLSDGEASVGFLTDITERKRAETELVDRLHFETLMADLSARFVNVAADQLGGEIEGAQRRVCECLGLDGCSLWQAPEEPSNSFKLTYTLRPLGGPPITIQMDAQEYFPWSYQQIVSGERNVIALSSLGELPKEAARDLETYRQFGVKSVLTIGLAAGGQPPVGALAFSSIRTEHAWPEEIVKRLQLVAQMFSNALSRQRSERALRESEERFRGLSNASLEGTMIHEQGLILDLNLAFARLFGYEQPEELFGRSGLEILLDPESRERVRQRIRRQETGPIEVTCVRKDGTTFLGETDSRPVKYLGHDATIVSCRDITQLKQAQEERQRSFDQLRALAARLQSVREEERKRLARDIHDQLGQALTAIKLDLSSLVRELPAAESTLSNKGSPLLQLVDETIESVRRISTELRPGMLDDLGLAATVEWAAEEFAARTGTKCLIDLLPDQIAIDSETATALFRIFQETLTNVARHANANEVKVRLAEEDGGLILEVRDNGRGIKEDELASADSLGILGMRERTLLLGGTLTITGSPGKGTTVRIRIPQAHRA